MTGEITTRPGRGRSARTTTARTPADYPTTRPAASRAVPLAPSTRRAYARWWARWASWCETAGRTPLPGTADTLASFTSELAAHGTSAPGIRQAVGAIRAAHATAGYPHQPPPASTSPTRQR